MAAVAEVTRGGTYGGGQSLGTGEAGMSKTMAARSANQGPNVGCTLRPLSLLAATPVSETTHLF